jgi:hypothetical protein
VNAESPIKAKERPAGEPNALDEATPTTAPSTDSRTCGVNGSIRITTSETAPDANGRREAR